MRRPTTAGVIGFVGLLIVSTLHSNKDLFATLENGRSKVLEAVRSGYSAAFQQLAPLVGVEGISGDQAARLVFPDTLLDEREEEDDRIDDTWILGNKLQVPGEPILTAKYFGGEYYDDSLDHCVRSKKLFQKLPGFQNGRFGHLSKGLRYGSDMYRATETRQQLK